MSHSDFDVVTGPSMAQRRPRGPKQSNKSSDLASDTGAQPAAQPEPADKILARYRGRFAETVRRSQRKPI
jgi:hypothetical protein